MKLFRKGVCCLLAFVMVAGLIPGMAVCAEETPISQEETVPATEFMEAEPAAVLEAVTEEVESTVSVEEEVSFSESAIRLPLPDALAKQRYSRDWQVPERSRGD